MRHHPVGTALTLAVAAAAALACQPRAQQQESAEGPAVDTAEVMATFDSMRSAFEAAVKAGDFDEQAAIYTADAVYSPPMAPPVRGRDSIRAALERGAPPGATLEIDPMTTKILGPDYVYEYGTSVLSFTPEGADSAVESSTTYFALFRRTPDGWRIEREVLGMNQPPGGGGN